MTSAELLQLDPSPTGRLQVLLMWGLVCGFFAGDEAKALRWFTTSNPQLGHLPPTSWLQDGQTGRLLLRVQSLLQENQR
jgi:hypothetical protein